MPLWQVRELKSCWVDYGGFMINITDKKDCCGCGSCAEICPKNCIEMKNDSEGFLYPLVDEKLCVSCNLCNKSCPMLIQTKENNSVVAYGCLNKDEAVRMKSSSGGVFDLLCKFIIKRNGVVFGAVFDDNFNVHHDFAETIENCEKFRGSKYVQSVIGDSYSKAKSFLDGKRTVLFTGTPCQIAGLYSFLKKDYPNLYTQDIACHSVPSPKVWNEYKQLISNGKKIKNIQFRNKETGWISGTFKAYLQDGQVMAEPYVNTAYMKGFLNGLYSRPSCYDCKFVALNQLSDITLADFWGVDTFYPELFDNKGTSLVFVNSVKGKQIFKFIKKDLKYKRVSIEKALWYNPALNSSALKNPNRDAFFKDKQDFNEKISANLYDFKISTNNYNFTFLDKIKFKVINFKEKE